MTSRQLRQNSARCSTLIGIFWALTGSPFRLTIYCQSHNGEKGTRMRKKTEHRRRLLWLTAILTLLATLAQAAQENPAPSTSRAVPVPITVRVFDGNRFVSDLTLKDFSIEEAGMGVPAQALFLVRKDTIERHEGRADVLPDVSRKLVLLFQMTDYHNKIPEALDYLFGSELLPSDTLEIETPMRNYVLSRAALASKSKAALARELADIIRKDVIRGGMAYNSALRDLKRAVRQIGGVGRTGLSDTEGEVNEGSSLEQQLMKYGEDLQQMETLRAVDETKLTAFARRMKNLTGQKLVFFVYQREFRPEINPQTLNTLVMSNQDRPDILAALQNLFPMNRRPINVNRELVMQTFADSGMDFQFLFINRQPERISGITMQEQSEDIYRVLNGAAEATGGNTDTSQNPAVSLAKALKATELSYILLYTPATSAPRGTYLDLKVKVKGREYRVAHRSGYLTSS